MIFNQQHAVIGMIHTRALPGAPKYGGDFNYIVDTAVKEAEIYRQSGIDVLMIENMHDVPYTNIEVGHEITSAMTLIGHLVKQATGLPMGIQILSAGNKQAMAVAKAVGMDFIRVEGYVFGHLADEGYIDSQAAELMRYRKQIDAEAIAVFTDIKKKHSSHALTADLDIAEMAHAADFFISDGVIVTGVHTGATADVEEIKAVRATTKLPLLIGSGINYDNVSTYLPLSDAMIVGSYFKKDGYWGNELDAGRIAGFMEKVNSLRG